MKTVCGILEKSGEETFITDESGTRHFASEKIWDGYIKHWTGKRVSARELPQVDYETGKPLILVWPHAEEEVSDHVEVYYNERLVKYRTSFMGHLAINIDGNVYNYSHLINESEIISEEEYLYRPALGEFAPHPVTGKFNTETPGRPYYDKFGRLFMRSIHVLRLYGTDTAGLKRIFDARLSVFRETPVNPKRPDHYRDFNIFTNSCSTVIRDGFREYGLRNVRGIFPRDIFVSIAHNIITGGEISAEYYLMKQLKVDEAPYSRMTACLNPLNRIRKRGLENICRDDGVS